MNRINLEFFFTFIALGFKGYKQKKIRRENHYELSFYGNLKWSQIDGTPEGLCLRDWIQTEMLLMAFWYPTISGFDNLQIKFTDRTQVHCVLKKIGHQ